MKRFFTLLLFIILYTSCEKIFTEDSRNQFSLETDEDFVNASAALYRSLYNSVCRMGYIVGSYENMVFMAIANGDDLKVGDDGWHSENDKISCSYTLESNMLCNTRYCGEFGGSSGCMPADFTVLYKKLFQTIGCANDILSKAGVESELNSTRKVIVGEIYFIRAYCYFRLARTFGQVPIVDNPDVSFTLKKPTFKELYGFIEKDILKSIELLPKSNSISRIPYETPSVGTAKALLAEVYLTMGGYPVYDNSKYAEAAKTAGEVINPSSGYGFGLMDDFADLWNGTKVKNMESVLAFYVTTDTDRFPYIENCCVPRVFYNKFPKGYRKEMTFHTTHVPYIYKVIMSPEFWIGYDSVYLKHYDTINNNVKIFYRKFYSDFNFPDSLLLRDMDSFTSDRYGHYTGQVTYLLRYAQTLLTYAEAKARSGSLDASAYDAVNQVRRRANKVDLFSPSPYDLKPGLTAEQFADSVVDERAWELCAEPEGRWFDLVRLNLAKDLIKLKQDQDIIIFATPIDRNTYFLPLPEEDRNLNPNFQ